MTTGTEGQRHANTSPSLEATICASMLPDAWVPHQASKCCCLVPWPIVPGHSASARYIGTLFWACVMHTVQSMLCVLCAVRACVALTGMGAACFAISSSTSTSSARTALETATSTDSSSTVSHRWSLDRADRWALFDRVDTVETLARFSSPPPLICLP